ncbi:MAG: hypothetical protein A2X35_07215 [Elusimicrobia bacterium GWA2_61_42]|nr:MAG: hypothetical protein A2X35_07215 [Elusimicrobia bacterium GWA2_61_42]OGR75001.1 MAG: hypothetical protein A2X38_01365 [Elusimicrobia bacterium GWC2_61_25]
MEIDKNKKDSVFSVVFPSREPSPDHAPASPAPRPAVSEELVAALNRKIEMLERNIAAQLEKKPSDMPPPPPPSLAIPAVISKIAEMESRLKEFQEKFLLGASQLKNIEESKISARREIEELLKAVREQQKYSELDRQMHAQLEKAWLRVEEMEKRMLDAYAAAANRPSPSPTPPVQAAAPVPSVPVERIVAEVLKAIDARLEERFGRVELMLKKSAVKTEDAAIASGDAGKRLAEISSSMEAVRADFAGELKQLRVEVFAGKERVEDLLEGLKKELLSSIGQAAGEGNDALLRHMDAVAIDGRGRLDEIVKMLMGHLEEAAARDRQIITQIALLEGNLKKENEKDLAAQSATAERLEKSLSAGIQDALAAAGKESACRLEEIRKSCGLNSGNVAALGAVEKNLMELQGQLSRLLGGLRGITRELEPVHLESLLGVSGAILRRGLETVRGMTAGIETEMTRLAGIKGEIAANIRTLSSGPGGEGK